VYAAGVEIGVYVVLVNWHLTADEIAYIVANSGASLVVTDDAHRATAEAAAGTVLVCSPAELADGAPDTPIADRVAGQAMFYTSGTTGQPKGVRKHYPQMVGDEVTLAAGIGMVTTGRPEIPPVDEARVVLISGPLYHGAPLAGAAGALDDGSTLVLMERFEPERFLDLVARYRVTHATMVPTMFHRLLALPDDVRDRADVSSLVAVTHAGAPCPIAVKQRMIEWFGPIVAEYYSSTEGAGTAISAEEWLQRPGSVGRASPGVDLKILDDDGAPCPPGVAGRVYVNQALWEFEYLGDVEKTNANRRDGLFTVGDIGYLDDEGYLFLCDREADVIVSGGVNIYPAEVEAILLTHPAVADAAVIGAPDDEWGEQVRAVVEVRVGATLDAEELVAYCRDRIAHFKAPRGVDFVATLGRDPNGKLRKGQLRDRYWEGRDRRI